MENKIASNIKILRKEKLLTQEQLAEALGVTVGAVYKWENGRSVPEISMLMKLADIFNVSLDALVGFEVLNGGATSIEKRIHNLQREKRYDEAVMEAEKALLRYPNDFKIVYRCGELYAAAGIEQENNKYLRRCIEFLEKAILLLSQNTDPAVSEVSIQTEIAQCHIILGETKKGIEILKKYNVSGVHNALIAIALTGNDITYTKTPGFELDDAVHYMEEAYGNILTSTLRTMMAYANYYFKKNDYASSRDALIWLVDFLESVKIDVDSVAYVDKVIAPCLSECANLSLLLGENHKVEPYMRRAYVAAKRYDANPTCKVVNLKFCIGDIKDSTTYDDLGETASAAVMKQITKEDRNEQLIRIWEQLAKEDYCE